MIEKVIPTYGLVDSAGITKMRKVDVQENKHLKAIQNAREPYCIIFHLYFEFCVFLYLNIEISTIYWCIKIQ